MTDAKGAKAPPDFGPLAGVRVVFSGVAVAGPFSAQMMAEWGADVIWIENPKTPDQIRFGSEGFSAEMERRNQRTLALDLASPKGQAVFLKLLETAEIFVESSKGGQFKRLGLTDEVMWKANPKLVIAHVSGFGQSGVPEMVERAAYDPIAQAFGCFMQLNGPPEGPPMPASPVPGDYMAGLFTASATLAALLRARATGQGESIDLAMFELLMRAGGQAAVEYLNLGIQPERRGSGHNKSVGIGLYGCKDGVDIYVVMHGSGVLQRGLALLGLSDPETFPPHLPFVSKTSPHAARVQQAMIDFCKARTAQEVEEQMSAAGLPCSKVYTYDLAEQDPHYQARGVFTEWPSETGRTVRGVKVAPEFARRPGRVWRGAPTIGQDNDMVLKDLGYGDAEIAELYADKVVAKREAAK